MLQYVNEEQLTCSSQIDNLIKQENILNKSINDTEESINTMRNAIFEMEPDTNSITDFKFFYNRIYEMERSANSIAKNRKELQELSLSHTHYANKYLEHIDFLNNTLN